MSKRKSYSAYEKYEILKSYDDGLMNRNEIISKFGVHNRTIQDWRYMFTTYGIEGLKASKTWNKYSQEIKESAVKDYLSGKYSLREVARKYEIPSNSSLRQWIKKYNNHREIKATSKGLSQSLTKGKTTSWKEKIDIVLFCIASNHDYQKTAEVHQVSYQQVYQWVKKYELGGEDTLKDGRGRKKNEEELTSEEKFKLEMKKLQADNERLRAENLLLKKLEQLEGRRY